MTYLLKSFFSLIQLLHSETGENSIASGITLGFILGFIPMFTPQALIILLLVFIFKVQVGAALLSWLGCSLLALIALPLLEPLGFYLLSTSSLEPLWTFLFNIPGSHLSLLNNSLVLGGFITSIVLTPLVFIISKALLKKYRQSIGKKINNSKFARLIKATKLYSFYTTYEKFK